MSLAIENGLKEVEIRIQAGAMIEGMHFHFNKPVRIIMGKGSQLLNTTIDDPCSFESAGYTVVRGCTFGKTIDVQCADGWLRMGK